MTARQAFPNRCLGVAAVAAALVLLAAPAASAKKISLTKPVNAPVPDATAPVPPALVARPGLLISTIDVGKQGKAKKVRDVNVTVQTAGSTGTTPANDLRALLTAPSGAQSGLFSSLSGAAGAPNLSLGPLTLDDEARLRLGTGAPVNPLRLYAPWAGSATPFGTPLAVFDNGPAAGTWVLTIRDQIATETSSVVSWRLDIITGKPFKTK